MRHDVPPFLRRVSRDVPPHRPADRLRSTPAGIWRRDPPHPAPPAADDGAPPQIVPGVGIGPVRIGMTGTEAQEALAIFEVESHQCTIDVLTSHDRVVALGTRYGGCLQLALPSHAVGVMAVGTMLLPEVGGLGGTPAPSG